MTLSAGSRLRFVKTCRILLDTAMSALLVLLMYITDGGAGLHEVLGYVLTGLFVLHILLNFRWVRGVAPHIFSKRAAARTRLTFWLDLLIFTEIILVFLSGLIVAQVLLNARFDIVQWSNIHHFSAYAALVSISAHIGIHLPPLRLRPARGTDKASRRDGLRAALKAALALVFICAGTVAGYTYIFTRKSESFTAPFTYRYERPAEDGKTYYFPDAEYEDTDGNRLALGDFLSRLRCGGCSRACPLLALRCDKGAEYKASAEAQYVNGEPADIPSEPFSFPFPADVLSLAAFFVLLPCLNVKKPTPKS